MIHGEIAFLIGFALGAWLGSGAGFVLAAWWLSRGRAGDGGGI